ncbi:MAG: hypothetical protein JWM41_3415 [Gemmatimonadetes bacterium]|nr:hypothetical protein [Gemmatimonadota bacterium]
MPNYPISDTDRAALVDKLCEYYTEALDTGVRSLMDRMARANMGTATAYLDQGRDSWASMTAESRDKFTVMFEREVRSQSSLMLAGANDLAADAIPMAVNALKSLADKIPVPLVGTAVGKLLELAGGAAVTELRTRAFNEADARVTASSGAEVRKLFTSDEVAAEAMKTALEQYKLIGRHITTMPSKLTSFQEIVTFPKSVFKVRQAASSLNVSLVQIRDYIDSMQTRLDAVQKVYVNYETQLRTCLPDAVLNVLESAYDSGYTKGGLKIMTRTYKPIADPVFRAPAQSGGATHLAAHITCAIATGYFVAGIGSVAGPERGRSRGVLTGENGETAAPGYGRGRASAPPPPLSLPVKRR